ncbi:SOS response-associated peptidase [Muricauda sp. CAU 1633]|uniref:SOS response-associated peptidase n=1 Tax=Allomuricauda sp. CAU 1633 TaxID=2816036 RepID=UPI001A8DA735|nr:SOS response-associated peptidase family protein [Muricauda sp. CAU 1633]MBO0323046.1 SOS response-associated peptidase [Muricauda sp. CAU 1633]
MCYSTRQTKTKQQLELHFRAKALTGERELENDLVYYHANGWNHPLMWILPQEAPNTITPAMWGIMPSKSVGADYKEYFKNPRTFGGLNAKSEKLFDHFIYRYSWEHKRCIIPVDGFFEPHTTPVKVKGKPFKVPFYFKRKNDDPIYLAGIYTTTSDGWNTFTILTKPATPRFEEVHNDKKRRPVIIDDESLGSWLFDGNDHSDVEQLMEDDLWEGELESYPVSKDLYSRTVDSNTKDIIKLTDYEEIKIEY